MERNTQQGEVWPNHPAPRNPRPGESINDAIAWALIQQQGELHGEIDGQTITVTSKNVEELTIWISDGMIDWQQPIRVVAEGAEVFNGPVAPDLLVCLSQAARTYDFDRLRWAA